MARYGIVFDLNKCVRCRTCYVACKREHGILAHPRDEGHPYEYYRLRYVEWEWGRFPTVKRAHVPVLCMHCEDPICMSFCPVDAIKKRSDGITVIDKARCNGCGACLYTCPYGALYINPEGKADGCDLCVARIDAGLRPRCAEECPSGERTVLCGDLDDPRSEVSSLVASGKARPLLLGGVRTTSVYYVPSANEGAWDKLPASEGFLKALEQRKIDLPRLSGIL